MSLWKEIWLPHRTAHFMLNVVGLLALGILKKNRELLRRKHQILAKKYYKGSDMFFTRNAKLLKNKLFLKQPFEVYSAVRSKGKITRKYLHTRKFPEISIYFNVMDRILDKKIPFTPINAFKSVMGLLPTSYLKSPDYFKKDKRIKIGWEWFFISRSKLNTNMTAASASAFRGWWCRRLGRRLKWWKRVRRRRRFFRWKFVKRNYWRMIGKRYLYNIKNTKKGGNFLSYSVKPSYNFFYRYLKQASFDFSYYFSSNKFKSYPLVFNFNKVKPLLYSGIMSIPDLKNSKKVSYSNILLSWRGLSLNFTIFLGNNAALESRSLATSDTFSYNTVFTLKQFFNHNAVDLATTEPVFRDESYTYGIKFSNYFETKYNFFYYFIFNFLKTINSRNVYFQFTSDIESHFSRIFLTRRYIWYLGWWWWYDIFKYVMDPERAVDVYYIAVLTKDVFIYKAFLKRLLERKHLKLHKKIFKFMILITEYYYSECYKEAGICGVRLELKGKISRTGNLRKIKMFRKVLQSSTSNYNYKTRHLFFPVRTKTGALGCRIWFYYR